MAKALVLKQGAAQTPSITVMDLEVSTPSPSQVKVRTISAPLSQPDADSLTFGNKSLNQSGILGFIALAEITEVGKQVSGFYPQERVLVFTGKSGGALCSEQLYSPQQLLKLPEDIDSKTLLSNFIPALWAHTLICRTYIVRTANAVLIHNITDPCNQILAKWCKFRGAYVIGTVLDNNDKQEALKLCDNVFHYKDENWSDEIMKLTQNLGINCVFDSVGDRDYIKKSMDCLLKAGLYAMHSNALKQDTSFETNQLLRNSIFVTCVNFFDYKLKYEELVLCAEDIFNAMKNKIFKPVEHFNIGLNEVHKSLELMQNNKIKTVPLLNFKDLNW